jgi:hypothetical protein
MTVMVMWSGNRIPIMCWTQEFWKLQNFVFGVFNSILLTPCGHAILHKHVDELDAQLVYCHLVAFYGKGIYAQITATSIETKLTLYSFATARPVLPF